MCDEYSVKMSLLLNSALGKVKRLVHSPSPFLLRGMTIQHIDLDTPSTHSSTTCSNCLLFQIRTIPGFLGYKLVEYHGLSSHGNTNTGDSQSLQLQELCTGLRSPVETRMMFSLLQHDSC